MRLLSVISFVVISQSAAAQSTTNKSTAVIEDPMIQEFSKRHQELMPKVAVADMFYGCHIANNAAEFKLSALINDMDRTLLADKLTACLGEDSIASDKALNFGITACFIDQIGHLPKDEQSQRLAQVKAVLPDLPRGERQKSFTQCVNNQTLKYMAE